MSILVTVILLVVIGCCQIGAIIPNAVKLNFHNYEDAFYLGAQPDAHFVIPRSLILYIKSKQINVY